jgi:hypothetical protein
MTTNDETNWLDNIGPGDKFALQIGDQIYTDIISEIKHESPLYPDSPKVSWWQRILRRLHLAPTPAPPAALPVTTITCGQESPAIHAVNVERALASVTAALAAIEAFEADQ